MSNFSYNYALNTPVSSGDIPFRLVKTEIQSKITRQPYYRFMFSPLVGAAGSEEGISSVIAFDATPSMTQRGAAKVIIPMRRAVPIGTLPTHGDTMHTSFSTDFASNLSTGMNLGDVDVYAGRIRFSETVKGKESYRMVEYLKLLEEMSTQLEETFLQNLEEEVIFALHKGYSRNVTTFLGRGTTGDKSHFQITPETFKRSNLVSTYDLTVLTHPNETFPRISTHMASAAKTAETMRDAITAAANAGDQISLDLLDSIAEYCMSRKMEKVSTPWGLNYLMFVPPCIATALRQNDDWRTSHQNADVRGKGNLLWERAEGAYGGILVIESSYILPAYDGNSANDGRDGLNDIPAAATDVQTSWGDDANPALWPCYLVGRNALGMALPQGVQTTFEEYDGKNVKILIGDKVHGLRRCDFFDDAEALNRAADVEAQPGQTPLVFNWSSAILWLYQVPTVM